MNLFNRNAEIVDLHKVSPVRRHGTLLYDINQLPGSGLYEPAKLYEIRLVLSRRFTTIDEHYDTSLEIAKRQMLGYLYSDILEGLDEVARAVCAMDDKAALEAVAKLRNHITEVWLNGN